MEEALAKRNKILEEVLPYLFKPESNPSEKLIRHIGIHQALAAAPLRITKAKGIKVDVAAVIDKYAVCSGIIIEKESQSRRCPISQCTIEKEWRGECGHAFEEAAVLAYLKQSTKCPVIGCNRRLVKKR